MTVSSVLVGKSVQRIAFALGDIFIAPEAGFSSIDMSFTRTWTVRFSDTDPFGIAHYPRMIDAVHETSDMFMESINWPFWELIGEHNVGLPVVSMDFDFHEQICAGDDVEIRLTTDVGESSVRFDYEAAHDGEVVFSGTEYRVCVPVDGDSGVPVPDKLRAAIEGAS
jgi:4-hydroxybenzoyl-CoA thioesterase